MRSNYHRAVSYSFKCCPPLCKDIVHEAYVRHFDKHGTNLFDRDIYVVLRWVKNVWFNEVRSNRYQKNGELFNRQFVDVDDLNLSSGAPPDQEVISKEFYQELFKRVDEYTSGHNSSVDTKVLRKFIELVDSGYTYPEMVKELGMSAQRLHYYKKKIQKIIKQMEMKSPFNGDYTKISKKITRKTFESSEQYKDYKYDAEAGCDFNEHYQTVTNGIDFIIIREKGD